MALISHMARLGSSQPVELCTSLDEVVVGFDITTFGAAPTKFDVQDLFPLTAHLLAQKPYTAVADPIRSLGVPDAIAEAFWLMARENITTLADLAPWWALCRDGAEPLVAEDDREMVAAAFDLLPDPPFGPESWADWTAAVKEATGRKGKGLFMPLRKALTGRERGPEMAALMPLLQKVNR